MKTIYFTLVVFLISVAYCKAQNQDSIKIYRADGVEVSTNKEKSMQKALQRDNYESVINNFGFNLIRKGTFFAQDIYSDGFKRDNINVVIDGELYHSACPNRMDSPLTRVNPADINLVEFSKSATDANAGIGGKVEFARTKPISATYGKIEATGISAGTNAMDLSADFNMKSNKLSIRYSNGSPYLDGDGRSFKELYGYKDDYNYSLMEVAYYGKKKDFEWRASFMHNQDIQFPYLQMDEIMNSLASAFVSYKSNKLYFNFTDHLMNNTLRVSPMFMESGATNATVGLNGKFYDAYWRNWNVSNEMSATKPGTKMLMQMKNEMIPNLQEIGAVINHKIEVAGIKLSGKAGVNYQSTDDVNDEFMRTAYPDHESNRMLYLAALSAGTNLEIASELKFFANADFALDAPSSEQLFIKVQKLMGKPSWIGNSTLDQPIRAGLRTGFTYGDFAIEGFANHITNFVDLNSFKINEMTYQSYYNTTGLLAGVNFSYNSKYFDAEAIYNWGENLDTKEPLAEIRPFATVARVKYAPLENLNLALVHNFEYAQNRVAASLYEFTTPTWNRLDIAASYSIKGINMYFEIENLLGNTYYRHLSFARNPFSAGIPVMESGRLFRLSFSYAYEFK